MFPSSERSVDVSSQYRVLEFIPDPFLGVGVPYGALVRERGVVVPALAQRIPGANCLGGTAAARALAYCRDLASSIDSFDALPLWAGPQVRLGPVREVPQGVENPIAWVVEHVLPRPADDSVRRSVRAPRRTVVAETFLRSCDLRRWVHRGFEPEVHLRERMAGRTANLPSVSHFVMRGDRLLLLEGVRPSVETDLQQVATTFLAYGELLRKLGVRDTSERLAYLLPGGDRDGRAALAEQLRDATDRVIDVNDVPGRTAFREHVVKVAQGWSLLQ